MTTTVRRATPALDSLLRQVREIGGAYEVRIELSRESVEKAVWLRDSARDFFSVTPSMQGSVARAVMAAARAGGLVTLASVAPEAIRAHIVRRFEAGGYDMQLRRLNPEYRAWKIAKGFDRRIGIMTGALLDNVRTARIWLEKVA